jgi:hypothetical protein
LVATGSLLFVTGTGLATDEGTCQIHIPLRAKFLGRHLYRTPEWTPHIVMEDIYPAEAGQFLPCPLPQRVSHPLQRCRRPLLLFDQSRGFLGSAVLSTIMTFAPSRAKDSCGPAISHPGQSIRRRLRSQLCLSDAGCEHFSYTFKRLSYEFQCGQSMAHPVPFADHFAFRNLNGASYDPCFPDRQWVEVSGRVQSDKLDPHRTGLPSSNSPASIHGLTSSGIDSIFRRLQSLGVQSRPAKYFCPHPDMPVQQRSFAENKLFPEPA